MTHNESITLLPLNPETQPPPLEIPVMEALPADAILRVKADSMTSIQCWRAESVSLSDGTPCEELARYSLEAHRLDWSGVGSRSAMITVRLPKAVKKDEKIILCSSFRRPNAPEGEPGMPPLAHPIRRPFFVGMRWGVTLEVVDSVDTLKGKPVSQYYGFQFSEGEAASLSAIWKADGTLNLRYSDLYGNPVSHKALLTVDALAEDSVTEMLALSDNLTENCLNIGNNYPLGHRITITDEHGLTTLSNPLPLTGDGSNVYFGEIHWHCELSCDGHRPLSDAMKTARDEICLDFAGPADHIWSGGDFGEDATPEMQVEVLRAFNDPGTFACFPGAEFSCGVGHANFYCDNFDRYLEVCRNLPAASAKSKCKREGEYDWSTLVEAAKDGHTLLIPHHPNTNSYVGEGVIHPDTKRPFWNAMTFPRGPEMDWIKGYEIYQVRGSFEDETTDPSWRIYHGGYGASARTALAKGYRFGFTAGTDNHTGFPSRSSHTGKVDGLTAIIADELSPEALWKALNARRSYATTGARIICDVTLNGQPIGSELQLEWDEPRIMRIRIHGTAPLESAQVISAGVVLHELPVDPDSPDLVTDWEDTRPGRPLHDVYYYLRVRQQDGNLAWVSPFWIDLKR